MLHHLPRQVRVVGLRDQLDAVTGRTDDHGLLRTAFVSGMFPRTIRWVTLPCASLTNSKPAGVAVDMNCVWDVGISGSFGSFSPRTNSRSSTAVITTSRPGVNS